MRVTIFLALLLAAKPALADADPEPVHEGVAFALSLGGTAASWGLVLGASRMDHMDNARNVLTTAGLVGTFVAPSAGHWYADKFLTRGLASRALGVGATVLGIGMLAGCIGEHADCGSDGAFAGLLLISGAGLYTYGTIHDIVTAPRSARAHNAEVARTLALAPMLTPTTTGFAIGGSF